MIAAILAGGENTRIPVPKGLLVIEGKTIVERSLDVLTRVFDRVVISTNAPEYYFRFGVPLIGDVRRERGPMTGVFSVFAATEADALFVVACDMPFPSEGLIRSLVNTFEQQRPSGEPIDAVIPLFEGKPEPLFGIYGARVRDRMEALISEGKSGLNDLLPVITVAYVDEAAVRAVDPLCRSFVNLNTREDYEKIGGTLCLG